MVGFLCLIIVVSQVETQKLRSIRLLTFSENERPFENSDRQVVSGVALSQCLLCCDLNN